MASAVTNVWKTSAACWSADRAMRAGLDAARPRRSRSQLEADRSHRRNPANPRSTTGSHSKSQSPKPRPRPPFSAHNWPIFNEYVKTHPEVRVIASEGLTVEGFGNSSQLLQIAGGIAPDVFYLYYQQAHSYIEQGFVAPLDEYLDKWDGKDKVPPQCWPVVTGRRRQALRRYRHLADGLSRLPQGLLRGSGAGPEAARRRRGTSCSSTPSG